MKLLLKLLTVVVMVFSVHECIMAQRQIGQLEPEALYDEALMLYENHHYGAAIELFGEYLEKTEGLNVRCYNIEDVPVQIWIFVGVAIVLVIYITIRIRMSHYREKK